MFGTYYLLQRKNTSFQECYPCLVPLISGPSDPRRQRTRSVRGFLRPASLSAPGTLLPMAYQQAVQVVLDVIWYPLVQMHVSRLPVGALGHPAEPFRDSPHLSWSEEESKLAQMEVSGLPSRALGQPTEPFRDPNNRIRYYRKPRIWWKESSYFCDTSERTLIASWETQTRRLRSATPVLGSNMKKKSNML